MKTKAFLIQLGVVSAVFALLPLAVTSDYYRHMLILALMWVVIGTAWNLLAGYTGQISFGHAMFFGVGAYTAGLLVTKFDLSPWWGLALGGPVAALVGLFIGWVCFRLRGPYFALATIAVAEIFRLVAVTWVDVTNGMEGILIIQSFSGKLPYYYMALILAASCLLMIYIVMHSKWGYYFVAIREDQDAAESLGISNFRYKSISLLISSFFTGGIGAFYMNYMGFIDPEVVFNLQQISIMAILVAIIGGAGTIWGPAIGAFVMVGLKETFRSSFFGLAPKWTSEAHILAFGLLVIFVILFLANGIVGDWGKISRLWSRPKTPAQNGG